jgi:hypothetical protein
MSLIAGLPGLPSSVNVFDDIPLLVSDAINLLGLGTPQWGLFQDGVPAVIADNVVAFDFREDWRISKAPLEGGAFTSYNKVQIPFGIVLRFSAGGSAANRQALLESIEAIIGSMDLFDAVTPERTYSSVNPTHRDYHRSAENGKGLLVVDLHCELVNESVESEFGNTQSPTAAGQNDNGQVQAQSPNITPPQEVN